MVDNNKYLVVVSVLEGRNFPKRANHTLLVEAKFDGELLTTDPVDHAECPDFTQELAWELDKKSLHQHRLQRSSVRVQVYSQDSSSSAREAVGYVVLDLRSAPSKSTPKWLPLLHGKYQRNKPDIRLSLYIDDDKVSQVTGNKVKEVKISTPATKAPVKVDPLTPRRLKPVLNELEGYYQIGPEQDDCEKFVLSVTVAFAANLLQLIPSNIALPSSGYYFYYSMIGNDITNEVFHDLLNPTFPAERASVRLSATLEILRQFFATQPGLQLHLCCGEQSLGSCEIPLNTLLKKGSTEIFMKPVTVEGAFSLSPPKSAKLIPSAMGPDDQKPIVGVSVVMRREVLPSEASNLHVKENVPSRTVELKKPALPPSEDRTVLAGRQEITPPHLDDPLPRLPSPPSPHDGSYTETIESRTRSDDSSNDRKAKQSKVAEKSNGISHKSKASNNELPAAEGSLATKHTTMQSTNAAEVTGREVDESSSLSLHYLAVPEQPHHFSVSLDLRCISNLRIQHPTFVFLRYTYIFFGSTAPILTQPPVEVRRGTEVLLPQSFCAFDFATTFQQLQETFSRIPLIVEVWQRDEQLSQNNCLGVAHIDLSTVIKVLKAKAVHSSGVNGSRQTSSSWIPIENTDEEHGHIGDIQVVLCLEDWGPISQPQVVVDHTNRNVKEAVNKSAEVPPQTGAVHVSPRETQEYKVALELEMWKQQQESLFEEHLKQKEKQLMKSLAEEWKRNEKERDLITKKQKSEYHQLEEQLRKTLTDLEKREKLLAIGEQDIFRHRADLEREHERKMKDISEASRRLKEDCDHVVTLERKKVRDIEESLGKAKYQLAEMEARNQQQSREFSVYKDQQKTKPEVRLQSEMNLLLLEKVELERKLDAATKSKVHYKQQWGRALKELARLKQKEQTQARAHLRKQQVELEQMRMRYLAAQEKEVVKTERKELQELKNELNHLKDSELNRSDPPRSTAKSLHADYNYSDDDGGGHVTRLIEERDTLLRTGVYTSDDKIISELDRQIREAMAIHTR